jgi:pimeloyl-ACP methyl ester carboxylesterase
VAKVINIVAGAHYRRWLGIIAAYVIKVFQLAGFGRRIQSNILNRKDGLSVIEIIREFFMSLVRGLPIIISLWAGTVFSGEPVSLWLDDAVKKRVGDLGFHDCSISHQHKTRYMECAYLDVPEDYTNPQGARLSLFIARLPAGGARVSADPLLAMEGGPGGSSSVSFSELNRIFRDLARSRDIYLIDQRGTGFSRRQDCELESSLDNALLEFDEDAIRDASRECLQNFKGDPRQYTTSVAIQDFEMVRKALGIAAWNLYGGSYGTRVVQHYMRRYPSAIRTAVLDSVAPPALSLGPDIALQSQAALDAFFELCAADAKCAEQFPDFRYQVNRLLAELKKRPVTVEYEDIKTGGRVEMQFTHGHLMVVIRMVLYKTESLSTLPVMLHQAYALNDFSSLARIVIQITGKISSPIAMGMHNAVVCSEDVPYYEPVPVDTLAASYIGTQVLDGLRAMCADWPVGVVDADFKQALHSEIPVLLISGEYDPATPPAYAEEAGKGLVRSKHLIAPGQGHGVAFSGCMPRIIAQFVDTADVSGLRSDCLSRLEAAPVFINLNGPSP